MKNLRRLILVCYVIFCGFFFGCASTHDNANSYETINRQNEMLYLKDAKSGCKIYNPTPFGKEKIEWSGSCKNGLAEGYGIVTWFRDDKRVGTYTGSYKEGVKHGNGIWKDDVAEAKRLWELWEKPAFEKAKKTDTVESYDAYLREYPNGAYVAETKSLREKVYFDNAKLSNTNANYNTYLKEYPNGAYVAEAKSLRELREKVSFDNAKLSKTVAGYDEYLKEYPNGTYVAEVQKLKSEKLLSVEAERIATEKEKQRREEIAEKQRRKDLEKAEKQRREEIEQLKKELFSWRNKLREGDEVQTTFITDMTFFGKDMSSSTIWYIERIYSNGDLLLKSGSSTKKVAISYVYPPYWSLSKVKILVW